jgi:hypothetical protein
VAVERQVSGASVSDTQVVGEGAGGGVVTPACRLFGSTAPAATYVASRTANLMASILIYYSRQLGAGSFVR